MPFATVAITKVAKNGAPEWSTDEAPPEEVPV